MTQGRDRARRTVHAAATPGHCAQMAKKYGWKLKQFTPNGNRILPVDCEFEGEAQFPNYMEDE
ncbi:MAG: hypothetical protein DCF17_20135 [Shackletoniella antarctica]|uniref:Uncharacterized protein n=1 Tax=Shackletoniella antarctica TaxID=268115 RepID=A0A2W4VQ03_9CYAN|nr:MAG: hypothetical protein DCF17_20135 [Shackletoniella antarctica]